jgi:predicted DNA-binding antitoxin AbrB/MazE fold protein
MKVGAIMPKEIRARFARGVIEPLEKVEKVELEEGEEITEEITIVISERAKGKGMWEALRATAGAWKDLIDGEELKRNIYADRLINTRPEPKL